ncbi:MAG: sigma-54-dependent Fis family transcriptional regulator [Calditrichaeota bacterium]|nr:sigma-54-dependent Fis family transcriptional regulator [Calditrichota bacterium]MCB0305307.1 sigma-54-dependent Fis family transcriptional regulator [Calditrichota bacterium]MCB9089145.1 sigma-54-dependent Fis family transcriptional regulator [Calditrichia bacterium]
MESNKRPKILAVDDEQSSLNAIYRTLRREFEVFLSLNGHSALEILKNEEIDVILADQRMPEMSGVAFFQRAIALQPAAMRILITGYTDVDTIIQAVNEGQIFHYISKPWEPEDLRITVRRAGEQYRLIKENKRLLRELAEANQRLQKENVILHQEMERQYTFDNIIGNSKAMHDVFRLMKKVIPTSTSVLLLGETGTGKELIARAIHFNGPRREKMFVAQNCGALPDTLLESELFGHVRGAFTGAAADKKGLFEIADGGTVFLDEISDTSPAMQQRLLRVLQEGEIHPLGSERTIQVDVRIISAANRSLEDAIREGNFREDLYYRLNVFPIRIPPLRERREDIPLLTEFFLEKFARKMGKSGLILSRESLSQMMAADFPGNVRQLENLVERAVTLADDRAEITPDLLETDPTRRREGGTAAAGPDLTGANSLKEIVEAMERYYIDEALQHFQGNITKTAEKLGLSRLGLHKKMQRYEIDSTKYKRR